LEGLPEQVHLRAVVERVREQREHACLGHCHEAEQGVELPPGGERPDVLRVGHAPNQAEHSPFDARGRQERHCVSSCHANLFKVGGR